MSSPSPPRDIRFATEIKEMMSIERAANTTVSVRTAGVLGDVVNAIFGEAFRRGV